MIITLKRSGKCADCGRELMAGTKAKWYRNGAIYCLDGHNGKSNGKSNGNTGESKPQTDWLAILQQANDAANKAYDDFVAEHYQRPNIAVVQHADPLDDSSPVVKAYPIADCCGFVWMDFPLKHGRNAELVKWFKANSQKPYYQNESDRSWQVDQFGLTYTKNPGVWSYPWELHAPAVSYGLGTLSASEKAGDVFCEVLAKYDLDITCHARMD